MDVMMPRLDGWVAHLVMRARPNGDGVPVVPMNAAVDPTRLDPGAAAFLAKPFDLERLLGLVARLLVGA